MFGDEPKNILKGSDSDGVESLHVFQQKFDVEELMKPLSHYS